MTNFNVNGLQTYNYNGTSLNIERAHAQNEHIQEQVKTAVQQNTPYKINKEDVQDAVDKLNDFFEPVHRKLKFEMHDKLDQYYVKVVDSMTDEVIKEIPPKKMLDMYAAMAEFMGILIDEKI